MKDRASVPYNPEDYEQDEPVVQEKAPAEARSVRVGRVNDPRVATSAAPKARTYSTDLPIGEEGDALPL